MPSKPAPNVPPQYDLLAGSALLVLFLAETDGVATAVKRAPLYEWVARGMRSFLEENKDLAGHEKHLSAPGWWGQFNEALSLLLEDGAIGVNVDGYALTAAGREIATRGRSCRMMQALRRASPALA